MRRFTPLVVSALMALLWGCAHGPRSTRLSVGDVELMASEMAGQLHTSGFLAGRNPKSPRITIAVEKVENLSTDLLSEGEKWYLVDRVLDADTMRSLRSARNISFVIPIEKLRLLRAHVPEASRAASKRRPTHVMTALLRSLTRTAGADRTEVYDIEFRIVELDSGELAWSDHFAIKRIATGRLYN